MEREALQRIVVLLLALAALAERAAGRSFPVRWLVLSRLWQADDVARDFFVGPSCAAAARHRPPTWEAVSHGHKPVDAINLAVSLRALALVVQNIAARLRHQAVLAHPSGGSRDGSHQRLVKSLWRAANAGLEPLDTS